MKLSKQLFVFSALLVIGGVVLLFTLRKAPIAHAATAPTLDWRTLPEDSPLDGAVTPAAFVLRADEGKIKIGDVITMANRAQPEAGLEQAKGRVFLFRGREITPLKPALEKTVNMKTKFVVRYFAYRPGSEVEIGDVITKINGAEFNSGDEFVRLARNANVITFLRNVGGQWIEDTRKIDRVRRVGTARPALVGMAFDCDTYSEGSCHSGHCHETEPSPTWPKAFCGHYSDADGPWPEANCCSVYR